MELQSSFSSDVFTLRDSLYSLLCQEAMKVLDLRQLLRGLFEV